MTDIRFEDLPEMVRQLNKNVDDLKTLITDKAFGKTGSDDKELLTIQEAAEFLSLTVPTMYSKTSRGELPGVCKRNGRLYFDKQVLIDWIKSGRRLSNDELQANPEALLKKKRKKQ
ncbi:MAG: helix-turn-helix domain-containing protein [Bacteroidota bacterium]